VFVEEAEAESSLLLIFGVEAWSWVMPSLG
jgi:hypothetical protein